MTKPRLRIVRKHKKEEPKKPDEVDLYYFTIEEACYNLRVFNGWVNRQLTYLPSRVKRDGKWYFSPQDYRLLRKFRDEKPCPRPAVG